METIITALKKRKEPIYATYKSTHKFKNKFSIIFVENVGQDIEQHCLEEDYIDELYDYYSDYDYPHD